MVDVFDEMVREADALAEKYLSKCEERRPEELGLDRRAASILHVCDEFIAVNSFDNRNLQYYGGFEYVDSEFTFSLGNYVFYFAEDSRVRGHIEQLNYEECDTEE